MSSPNIRHSRVELDTALYAVYGCCVSLYWEASAATRVRVPERRKWAPSKAIQYDMAAFCRQVLAQMT